MKDDLRECEMDRLRELIFLQVCLIDVALCKCCLCVKFEAEDDRCGFASTRDACVDAMCMRATYNDGGNHVLDEHAPIAHTCHGLG